MLTDFISEHILSFLIFFPILGACFLFCIPQKYSESKCLKHTAFTIVGIEFILSLHLLYHYVANSYDFQFSSLAPWLPLPGVNYVIGIDGLSVYLVILSTFISLIVFFSIYSSIKTHLKSFLVCFLFLEGTLVGTLVSLDLFLFYFFWEASLIPLYFMIGIWGGKERIYATLKFFIYGVAGSLLMLVAFVYLYCASATTLSAYSSNILDIYHVANSLPATTQTWLFIAITLAFAIKVPLFPFYTWLADTYEQSPALYTMLSGVVLKLAAYGLIRFSLCFFPMIAKNYAPILITLGVINILYGAFIAWQQTNLRRIMSFSSLSHMGFIIIGIFAFTTMGLQGSLYQMINHSITAAAFFILFQFLEKNYQTLDINKFGGLAKNYPWFGFFFGIVAMSAVGLPSTGSFLGEWLILLGVFQSSSILGTFAALGVIFGAVYVLWFTYKVIFGPPIKQIDTIVFPGRARFQLSILCGIIFILGFASNQIFKLSDSTLLHVHESVSTQTEYQAQLTLLKEGKLIQIPH